MNLVGALAVVIGCLLGLLAVASLTYAFGYGHGWRDHEQGWPFRRWPNAVKEAMEDE